MQKCVLHLIRNTFRPASRKDWDRTARDLQHVYTAGNEADAAARLEQFHTIWGNRYPAIRTFVDERVVRVRAVLGLLT